MRKPVCAICACILMLAFTQFEIAGQRRVGPKPRPVPSSQPASPAPAPTPAEETNQTQEQSQSYKAGLEYQYLMELRFYENQGGFLVEGLEVVFPPPGLKKATLSYPDQTAKW